MRSLALRNRPPLRSMEDGTFPDLMHTTPSDEYNGPNETQHAASGGGGGNRPQEDAELRRNRRVGCSSGSMSDSRRRGRETARGSAEKKHHPQRSTTAAATTLRPGFRASNRWSRTLHKLACQPGNSSSSRRKRQPPADPNGPFHYDVVFTTSSVSQPTQSQHYSEEQEERREMAVRDERMFSNTAVLLFPKHVINTPRAAALHSIPSDPFRPPEPHEHMNNDSMEEDSEAPLDADAFLSSSTDPASFLAAVAPRVTMSTIQEEAEESSRTQHDLGGPSSSTVQTGPSPPQQHPPPTSSQTRANARTSSWVSASSNPPPNGASYSSSYMTVSSSSSSELPTTSSVSTATHSYNDGNDEQQQEKQPRERRHERSEKDEDEQDLSPLGHHTPRIGIQPFPVKKMHAAEATREMTTTRSDHGKPQVEQQQSPFCLSKHPSSPGFARSTTTTTSATNRSTAHRGRWDMVPAVGSPNRKRINHQRRGKLQNDPDDNDDVDSAPMSPPRKIDKSASSPPPALLPTPPSPPLHTTPSVQRPPSQLSSSPSSGYATPWIAVPPARTSSSEQSDKAEKNQAANSVAPGSPPKISASLPPPSSPRPDPTPRRHHASSDLSSSEQHPSPKLSNRKGGPPGPDSDPGWGPLIDETKMLLKRLQALGIENAFTEEEEILLSASCDQQDKYRHVASPKIVRSLSSDQQTGTRRLVIPKAFRSSDVVLSLRASSHDSSSTNVSTLAMASSDSRPRGDTIEARGRVVHRFQSSENAPTNMRSPTATATATATPGSIQSPTQVRSPAARFYAGSSFVANKTSSHSAAAEPHREQGRGATYLSPESHMRTNTKPRRSPIGKRPEVPIESSPPRFNSHLLYLPTLSTKPLKQSPPYLGSEDVPNPPLSLSSSYETSPARRVGLVKPNLSPRVPRRGWEETEQFGSRQVADVGLPKQGREPTDGREQLSRRQPHVEPPKAKMSEKCPSSIPENRTEQVDNALSPVREKSRTSNFISTAQEQKSPITLSPKPGGGSRLKSLIDKFENKNSAKNGVQTPASKHRHGRFYPESNPRESEHFSYYPTPESQGLQSVNSSFSRGFFWRSNPTPDKGSPRSSSPTLVEESTSTIDEVHDLSID